MEIITRLNPDNEHSVMLRSAFAELEKVDCVIERKPEKGLEKITSKRQLFLHDLYELYTSPKERIERKKINKVKYAKEYCPKNKLSKQDALKIENWNKFLESSSALKEMKMSTFCARLGHLNEEDLAFTLSNMRDRAKTGAAVSSWLLWSIAPKKQV